MPSETAFCWNAKQLFSNRIEFYLDNLDRQTEEQGKGEESMCVCVGGGGGGEGKLRNRKIAKVLKLSHPNYP